METGINLKKTLEIKKGSLNKKSNRLLLTMCVPIMLKLFLFAYVPMVGIVMAFQIYKPKNGIIGSPFVGLKNFEFFFKSGDALMVTMNTIIMNLIFIVTSTVVALILGLLMYEVTNKKFLKTIQTTLFFPYFISWTLVGIILGGFLDERGILTSLLSKITGNQYYFYDNPAGWRGILTVLNLWKSAGVGAIIYYANMISIDKEYYEAAKLDGANRMQCALKITMPFILPMLMVMTIMALGNIIRADFGIFYFATKNSAPLYPVTTVIDTMVFRMLEGASGFERAAAIGLFQSVFGFILIVSVNKLVRKIDKQSSLY